MNPDVDKAFWDYSFDEMGAYDIPAVLDFITLKTNIPRITYIGHSQGTSQMFSALTKKIDYFKSKLNGFVALGPVTNLKYSSSYVIQFAISLKLDSVASYLGVNEFLRGQEYQDPIIGYFCKFFSSLCDAVIGLIADKHPDEDDPAKLEEYMTNFPSGTSIKSLTHYAQINRRGEFVNYDYGKVENLKRYKTEIPPSYDVDQIKDFPICILFGNHDHLSGEKDNQALTKSLEKNNSLFLYKMYENMGHLTYFAPRDNRFLLDTLNCVEGFQKK